MLPPEQELKNLMEGLLLSVGSSFDHNSAAHILIALVREMDLTHGNLWLLPATGRTDYHSALAAARMIGFGYPAGLRQVYPAVAQVRCATHFFAGTMPGDIEWAQEILYQSGKAAISLRLLDGIPGGLVSLIRPSPFEFVFRYNHTACGIEYFDELDLSVVEEEFAVRIEDELARQDLLVTDETEALMRRSMSSPCNQFISYDPPDEVWDLFLQRASYWLLLQTAGYDFGPEDAFGGIRYDVYREAVRYLIAYGTMHTHYCRLLALQNPDIDEGVLLTYIDSKQRIVEDLSSFLEITESDATEVMGCLCLTPEHYEKYLEEPGAPPPPYLMMSDTQVIRSTAGCLANPCGFLNRMLKIRHPLDHSKMVNRREDRFIKDLGRLFEGERFIRIEKPVPVTIEKPVPGKKKKKDTDIDAVIYDTHTKSLGLFQLKWQDPLGESVRLRRTKAENFFEANEWVDIVCKWLQQRNGAEILKETQVMPQQPAQDALGEIFLFVLGRHNVHYTNSTPDARAVWGSWHGVMASRIQVAAFMEDDPIRELYTKLWLYQGENRLGRDEFPPAEYGMRLGPYHIQHLGR